MWSTSLMPTMLSVPPVLGVPVPGLSPVQPAATADVPVPPVVPFDELLLLHAASAVTPATAMASPPTTRWLNLIVSPPSSRCQRYRSALGSSCRPSSLASPPGQADRALEVRRRVTASEWLRSVIPGASRPAHGGSARRATGG